MKKRMMAILLAVVLAFSMMACGTDKEASSKKKTADISTVFDQLEDMKVRAMALTMDMDVSIKESSTKEANTIKIGLKVDGISQDDQKNQATIHYRLGNSTEYKALTTVIGDGTSAYFDFSTLKTAVIDICNTYKLSQAVTLISALPDANYIKADAKTVSKYLLGMSGTGLDVTAKNSNSSDVMRTIAEYVMKTVEEITKDVSPALISASEKECRFTLTKDNLEAGTEAVLKADLNAKYEELIERVKAMGVAESEVADLANGKEETILGLKDILTELKNEKDDFDVFNIEGSLSVSGDNGARKLTEKMVANVEQKSEKVALTMEAVCGEEAAKDAMVTIPSNAMDFTEYMNQLSSQLGD